MPRKRFASGAPAASRNDQKAKRSRRTPLTVLSKSDSVSLALWQSPYSPLLPTPWSPIGGSSTSRGTSWYRSTDQARPHRHPFGHAPSCFLGSLTCPEYNPLAGVIGLACARPRAAANSLSGRVRPEETPEVLEDPPRHVRFDRRCPTRLSHRKLVNIYEITRLSKAPVPRDRGRLFLPLPPGYALHLPCSERPAAWLAP